MISFRQKIAQLLIMGFAESELFEQSPVAHWIKSEGIGGVLLFDMDFQQQRFGKNLYNQEQIKRLIQQLKQQASKSLPVWVAIDYEGGAVDRLSRIDGCHKTITPEAQAQLSDEQFEAELQRMALTLKSLGFNLNFAPVVDLNLTNQQGIIGKLGRSFAADPSRVSQLAAKFVQTFKSQGITCCYKHFPGHGSALGDTHEGFVDVTSTYNPQELFPYRTLLKQSDQHTMIMTAHVINRQLDPNGLPATLSSAILGGLLRDEFGFNGIIISDDLQMQAISDHYSLADSLRLTLNAGADMVIFGNQLATHTAPEVIDCIEALVQSGAVSASRIEEAFARVSLLKSRSLY